MRRNCAVGVWIVAASLVGCGGGATTQEEEEPLALSGGDETPMPDPEPVEEEAEAEAEPEPEPTGPGQLTVQIRVAGQNVGGRVRVTDMGGAQVAEGASGATFNLDSGQYRVYGEITDAAIVVDRPSRESEDLATVPAGGTATANVDIPVARVRLNVRRNGSTVGGWRATVTRQGAGDNDPIVLEPSEQHIAITPGRYDAVVRVGGREITVSGVIFQGGATQTVPIDID